MTCRDAHGRWDRGNGSYVKKNGKRKWPVQERERERTKDELARPKCKGPQVWRLKLNRSQGDCLWGVKGINNGTKRAK
jgi:hypothetical protein